MTDLPRYRDLPLFEKTGERYAWGVWGKEDELGMLNLLTPERVVRATSLVKKGKVINIEPSRSIPHPLQAKQEPYVHHIERARNTRTDYADNFPLHGGMGHLDGYLHHRYREYGYYGGRQDEEIDRDKLLGIEKWGQHGFVGRGVLIDVPRHFERLGQRLDPNKRFPIGYALLEAIAKEEGVAFEPGDIMLLRTGWMGWYLGLTPEGREALDGSNRPADEPNPQMSRTHTKVGPWDCECPTLDRQMSTAEWLWNHQLVALWADNVALESLTLPSPDSQYQLGADAEMEGDGSMHRRMLALFGMGIGELFTFEELSKDCAKDGVYEFMVTAKPLNMPGLVASPANAYAIK